MPTWFGPSTGIQVSRLATREKLKVIPNTNGTHEYGGYLYIYVIQRGTTRSGAF